MPQCRATAPIGVVTIFREIRDSDLGMEASLRQRLGDIEGQARKDAARADAMLRDAMSDVIDNAQVRLSHFLLCVILLSGARQRVIHPLKGVIE